LFVFFFDWLSFLDSFTGDGFFVCPDAYGATLEPEGVPWLSPFIRFKDFAFNLPAGSLMINKVEFIMKQSLEETRPVFHENAYCFVNARFFRIETDQPWSNSNNFTLSCSMKTLGPGDARITRTDISKAKKRKHKKKLIFFNRR
jgi:hypothetical protein